MTALSLVRQFYPDVTSVSDAKKDLALEVISKDLLASKRKKHPECALAQACKRSYEVKGVVIALSVAYVINKDNVATRYKIPPSASREIIAFDRNGTFEPGAYTLQKPTKGEKLGYKPSHTNPDKGVNGKTKNRYRHLTENVRSLFEPL